MIRIDASRRLAELVKLREHYAEGDRPHIVSFLDRLIEEARAVSATGEGEVPAMPFTGRNAGPGDPAPPD